MDGNWYARRLVDRDIPASSRLGRYRLGGRMPPGYCRGHRAEPAFLALAKASEFSAGQPSVSFCIDCGRRLALASIHWSSWVLRRVEKVKFRDDRSVSRRISIDFLVRGDAPVYVASGGQKFWLVPVSVMRRKTLVNYDLRDEEGRSVPMPGLWLAQHFDESLLRAVASIEMNSPLGEDAGTFIHDVVTGNLEKVQEKVDSLKAGNAPAEILGLMDKSAFGVLLSRLSFHYTLYAFIEADPRRRHRILHMSIDEPLTLYHRRPGLLPGQMRRGLLLNRRSATDNSADGSAYKRGDVVRWYNPDRLAAALGWAPTRVRFPLPAAENAASFHFEVEAPPGVDIVEASLLAGVPPTTEESEDSRCPSFDHIRLRLPTVGLHVTDVPNGSSSRAQVHLQVATRGWYTTMLLSCWATFLLLGAVLLHVHTNAVTTSADAIVVLGGVAAAVATLIAQGEFPGMAGRLLTLPRALAAVEATLPLIAGTLFLFSGSGPVRRRQWELLVLCAIAAVITVVISIAWLQAHWRSRTSREVISPWEMAPGLQRLAGKPTSFWDAARKYGYTKPAIRVDSAEAWHRDFIWTKEVAEQAHALLVPVRPESMTRR